MMRDQANKIWQNIETNISPRRYVEANKHLKIYSTTLAIREIQNKTVGDIPLTCIKIAENKKKKKKMIIPSVDKDVEELELSYTVYSHILGV